MEMQDVKVSVICTAYNHSKYIRKCLDGFVMQKTNFKFEVLVHDDASTDDTADIIREYAEKYPDIIKPIYQTENQFSKGVKIGRTFLYPIAKGKYFAYCEGDDYWCDENKLQLQYDAMEAHPECYICVHATQRITEAGDKTDKIHPSIRYNLQEGILPAEKVCEMIFMKGDYPFQTSSYFIRAELEENMAQLSGTDFALTNGDMQILKAAIAKGPFFYIDRTMSCYRVLSIGSWSSRNQNSSQSQKKQRSFNCMKSNVFYNRYTTEQYQTYIYKAIGDDLLWLGTDVDYAAEIKKYRRILQYILKTSEYPIMYRAKAGVLCYCPAFYRLVFLIKGI